MNPAKRIHPIENMLEFRPGIPAQKVRINNKVQKNFQIDKNISKDFELLCKLNGSDFSKTLVAFITEETERNAEIIQKTKIRLGL